MDNLAGIFLLSLRFGLAIVLFLFLFWSIRVIWKDFTASAQKETQKVIPNVFLSLSSEDGLGKSFSTEEIIIGRAPTSDFQIYDETVSSKHAKLYYQHNQWWIEDLGSSNGSYLNDIYVTTPAVLTIGDQLRLGKITIDISFPE